MDSNSVRARSATHCDTSTRQSTGEEKQLAQVLSCSAVLEAAHQLRLQVAKKRSTPQRNPCLMAQCHALNVEMYDITCMCEMQLH